MQFTSVSRMDDEGFRKDSTVLDDICGWEVKFDNGWALSTQWHKGHYAEGDGSLVELAAYNEDDTAWWDFSRNKPVKPSTYVQPYVKRADIPKYMDQVGAIERVEVYLNLERGQSP